MKTTLAAAWVVLAMQAHAQDADYYVDRLWKAMGGGGLADLHEPELESLLAAMIADAGYVCDFVSVAWREGASPRGRAATVECGGDTRFFRVELWQDKSTFTVVPVPDPRG